MSVLHIGSFYSRCGACNGNADPYETAHENRQMHGEGCGAVYTAVAPALIGVPGFVERIREMRPDLPLLGES